MPHDEKMESPSSWSRNEELQVDDWMEVINRDVLGHILSYLPQSDLVRSRLVNVCWSHTILYFLRKLLIKFPTTESLKFISNALTNLERLVIQCNNRIDHTGFYFLAKMRNLRRLRVWNICEMTNPIETLQAIGSIHSLQYLFLDASPSETRGFRFGEKELSLLLPLQSRLRTLKLYRFWDFRETDFKVVSRFTELRKFCFQGQMQQLTGVHHLQACPNLQHLQLHKTRNFNEEDTKNLGKLNLISLDFQFCPVNVKPNLLVGLSQLTNLQRLRITQVEGIPFLPKLESLVFNGLKKVEEVHAISSLKSLKSLKLFEAGWFSSFETDEDIPDVSQYATLQHLKSVDVFYLWDIGCKLISAFRSIKTLSVHFCGAEYGLKYLECFPQLEELNVVELSPKQLQIMGRLKLKANIKYGLSAED